MDRSIPYSSLTIFTAYSIWSICLNSSCTLALSLVKSCIPFSRYDISFCHSFSLIDDVPVNFSIVFLALRYLSISLKNFCLEILLEHSPASKFLNEVVLSSNHFFRFYLLKSFLVFLRFYPSFVRLPDGLLSLFY